MEPRIQYARTIDGIAIAFYTLGDGPPLVVPPALFISHLQSEWEDELRAAWLSALAARCTVIRYDCRGMGMSERSEVDFSYEAAERDLDTVLGRLDVERFAMCTGPTQGGGPFAYAAKHPERVSRFIYTGGTLGRRAGEMGRLFHAIEPLIDSEWDLYTNVFARLLAGWDSPRATHIAKQIRAAHTSTSFRVAYAALDEEIPDELIAGVTAPALVLHAVQPEAHPTLGPGLSAHGDAVNRRMASLMKNAHIVAVAGAVYAPPSTAPIIEFVTQPDAVAASHRPGQEVLVSSVRTIIFTDLVGHSGFMERLGDAKGRELLREHERITREALREHGGAEVKAMGDGFLAWFPSPQLALESAISMQRAFAAFNETAQEPLRVRVGINAGEPIAEGDDIFGAAVIGAARIMRESSGEEILVSDVVRQLVAGKGFMFADRGQVLLRGFEDPVRIFALSWRST